MQLNRDEFDRSATAHNHKHDKAHETQKRPTTLAAPDIVNYRVAVIAVAAYIAHFYISISYADQAFGFKNFEADPRACSYTPPWTSLSPSRYQCSYYAGAG